MPKHSFAAAWLLLLLSSAPVRAQAAGPPPPPQAPAPEPGVGAFANHIDFGVRVSSISGDPARWQRYRDLRDGPVVNRFDFRFDTPDWLLRLNGDHVGYRDQRYRFEAERPGRFSGRFLWDQIPLFVSQDTLTLYREESPGILRIDDAIQSGIQSGTLTIRQAAAAAFGVTVRTRRDNGVGEFRVRVNDDTDAHLNFTTSKRSGEIPYGATFGFSNAIEVPLPIESRTTTVQTGIEWANQDAMVRMRWDGSWYDNQVETLVWDNPLRLTDTASAPGQGRMALWPGNTYHSLSSAASIKLPARSRLVGNVSLGWARQNEPLVPFTINSALTAPAMPRATAAASGQTASTYLALTSRPARRVTVAARHRYYKFENDTEPFARTGFVNYDSSVVTGASQPEVYSVFRQTLDLDVTTTFGPAAWKIGYGLQGGERTARHWEDTTEHAFRTSIDVVGQGPYSVRGLYEHARRTGDALDVHPLQEAGEQISMRHYDIADRDRDRTSIIVTAAPRPTFDVIGSLAVGRDDYTEEGIGLRDNTHRIYSLGVTVSPRETISAGVSYSFEEYDALINQRQATALDQAFDATRRWDVDTDDRAHTVLATFEWPQALAKTDLRVSYDYSNARTTFLYSLPPGSTLAAPQQLPPVRHAEHRLEWGVLRRLTARWSLGGDYWFDKYSVEDFALGGDIDQGIAFPIVEPGQTAPVTTVLLNYLYRPFRGHTGILRAVYSF